MTSFPCLHQAHQSLGQYDSLPAGPVPSFEADWQAHQDQTPIATMCVVDGNFKTSPNADYIAPIPPEPALSSNELCGARDWTRNPQTYDPARPWRAFCYRLPGNPTNDVAYHALRPHSFLAASHDPAIGRPVDEFWKPLFSLVYSTLYVAQKAKANMNVPEAMPASLWTDELRAGLLLLAKGVATFQQHADNVAFVQRGLLELRCWAEYCAALTAFEAQRLTLVRPPLPFVGAWFTENFATDLLKLSFVGVPCFVHRVTRFHFTAVRQVVEQPRSPILPSENEQDNDLRCLPARLPSAAAMGAGPNENLEHVGGDNNDNPVAENGDADTEMEESDVAGLEAWNATAADDDPAFMSLSSEEIPIRREPAVIRSEGGRSLHTFVPFQDPLDARLYLHQRFEDDCSSPAARATWESAIGPLTDPGPILQYAVPCYAHLRGGTRTTYPMNVMLWIRAKARIVAQLEDVPADQWITRSYQQWTSWFRPKGPLEDLCERYPKPLIPPSEHLERLGLVLPTSDEWNEALWECQTYLARSDFERLLILGHPSVTQAAISERALSWAILRDRARRAWGFHSYWPDAHGARSLDHPDDVVRLRHWLALGRILAELPLGMALASRLRSALGGDVEDVPQAFWEVYREVWVHFVRERNPVVFYERPYARLA